MSSPLLVYPDFDKLNTQEYNFVLQTDASDYACGAVLNQRDMKTGQDHPVAYWSKTLTECQRNYFPYDKEGLAVVQAVEHFKCYLSGRPFILETDHQALRHLLLQKSITSSRQMTYVSMLQAYEMDIVYRPGHSNANADCLSRLVKGKLIDIKCPVVKLHSVACQTPAAWVKQQTVD